MLVVTTTTTSREEADTISLLLVEARLAACVQVLGPIESRFRWQGRVETATEWMCVVKTTADRYGAVEQAIQSAHSYDEPEILAVAVEAGSAGYLASLRSGVTLARYDEPK